MSGLKEYPPNMAPQDALIVRRETPRDHAVVPYSGEDLARAKFGPVNPFKDETTGVKRKNVPTGFAEETYVSEHTFRAKHRAIERKGGPEREYQGGAAVKEEAARIRAARERKGDATVVEGDGAYVGPWARYRQEEYEVVGEGEQLASDEEYVEVTDEDEDDVVESGTVVRAPETALARRKEVEELGEETTTFHGAEERDYQGRTYMHVPQNLDVDLRKEVGNVTNYIPKKQIHGWKDHKGAVTGTRFFPGSGHLLLSASADATVKIWDVYHQRELLRTYSGHNKAVSDITFNLDGTRFLSASFDRQIKLWDTETGKCISRFSTGKTPHVVRFNPTVEHAHEFVAGMSDKKIIQWDTRAGNEIVQDYDHHLAAINTITFVDQGRRFMTTSDDKSLRAWDYNIPVPIKYIAEPYMYPMTRSALHPNGKYVAYQSSDNQVVVYGATDKFRQNRKKSYRGHNNAGTAIDVAISPDGQFLASGDTLGYICFWDWKTCKMYHKLKAGDQAITCLEWHPQETSKFVSAGMDGQIRYWD
ncbi:pre-mRNA-processing factor 17 [Sodiomyces alkalinus F11]|uniref:Pre-mRNA-processing factor 17 n=1 Tax=Sodiomyces alkalinus (strain CBS 110278 / VKM F-3762 / F11) TaxID=1314773 RepID=A0A3N2PPD5_SODAK|nr:pre-mRNA-processing factor 17 [Sodiomyces alkalinus F11]ROT36363.1 pre-mRNA-processing factor 17 [Sodiomyces alkalinus F11]